MDQVPLVGYNAATDRAARRPRGTGHPRSATRPAVAANRGGRSPVGRRRCRGAPRATSGAGRCRWVPIRQPRCVGDVREPDGVERSHDGRDQGTHVCLVDRLQDIAESPFRDGEEPRWRAPISTIAGIGRAGEAYREAISSLRKASSSALNRTTRSRFRGGMRRPGTTPHRRAASTSLTSGPKRYSFRNLYGNDVFSWMSPSPCCFSTLSAWRRRSFSSSSSTRFWCTRASLRSMCWRRRRLALLLRRGLRLSCGAICCSMRPTGSTSGLRPGRSATSLACPHLLRAHPGRRPGQAHAAGGPRSASS